LIKFTVILLYLFLIFLISIVFKKYNEDNKEIVRKIIHIGIGPLIPIAQFLKINQNSAIGIKGPIPMCIIFLTISLLSSLNFLKTTDTEKIKNKYKKITANFINLIRLLFDELSLLLVLILL